jgi:hypothetical protein
MCGAAMDVRFGQKADIIEMRLGPTSAPREVVWPHAAVNPQSWVSYFTLKIPTLSHIAGAGFLRPYEAR